MLDNIRAHSYKVAQVADYMARSLVEEGVSLDLDRIIAGALLHDIGKTACLDSDQNHASYGAQICREHGLTGIVEIVAEHVVLKDGLSASCCTEKEIVYYSDKRVLHEDVVTLEDRLHYILERYGKDNVRMCAAIRKNFLICQTLEKRLFRRLDFTPEELPDRITADGGISPFIASLEKTG